MTPFHVTWEIESNPQLTTGKDYIALNITDAIELFKAEHQDKKPLNVVDKSQLK